MSELEAIIAKADERGGHGFGFFGLHRSNHHVLHISHGRSDLSLLKTLAKDCVAGIGHSRLVTTGDKQILNGQPIIGNGIALVHNGNIPNYQEIIEAYNYTPKSNLDSEALIPLIQNHAIIEQQGAFLSVTFDKAEFKFTKYQNEFPLTTRVRGETVYYCSKDWLIS